MFAARFFTAGATALILVGSATVAHAQSKPRAATPDFAVKSDFSNPASLAPFNPQQGPKKSLQWDNKKGKWGLKLDLDQPVGREMEMKDVQAGAYYSVTPSLRVGGAVALGDNNPAMAARKNDLKEPAPRVKLETAFKF
ncbi:MAG: hypothetical protein J7521_17770 [Caulobacter sp.]|nr:hypothetical protein [Caulobacter sp.]